ncbi:MAG: hypothetical protein KBD55_01455 [Candidatus Pacebacteria bacterium]|jgi:hypothetical protein|nr:hypothetical protein [Candidatus Paceibacterota bacterium]
MGFETPKDRSKEQFELAGDLDELMLKNGVEVVEAAIRYMAVNTRQTLLRAIEMAERTSPGATKIENPLN